MFSSVIAQAPSKLVIRRKKDLTEKLEEGIKDSFLNLILSKQLTKIEQNIKIILGDINEIKRKNNINNSNINSINSNIHFV